MSEVTVSIPAPLREFTAGAAEIRLDAPIGDMMTVQPKRVTRSGLAARALKIMEDHAITSLFVFDNDESRKPVGVLHLHDLLKAGIY